MTFTIGSNVVIFTPLSKGTKGIGGLHTSKGSFVIKTAVKHPGNENRKHCLK